MDKRSIVLAALAPAEGKTHTPAQVQKMLFLIDKNIPGNVGGPHFNFQPYDYGPFDRDVYSVLESLVKEGLVEAVETNYAWKKFSLTPKGQMTGTQRLNEIDARGKEYITNLSRLIRSLSFEQLVSAIYKAYPDMKQNSVFRD